MSVRRVRIVDDPAIHIVDWYDNVGGTSRCRIDFAWRPNDRRANARSVATMVENDCDCMTCLVRDSRATIFHMFETKGVAVINIESVGKLRLFDEE